MTISNHTFDNKITILNLMRLLRVIFSCISIILISACSASYKELSNNEYTPPTKFAKYLKTIMLNLFL